VRVLTRFAIVVVLATAGTVGRHRPRLLLDARPRRRALRHRADPAVVLPGDPLGARSRRRRRDATV